uniref:Uncharacterized protein n=1 Tax=Oryza barthii TaxID=65489 RepID=A0A0D3HL40_9ORYZ
PSILFQPVVQACKEYVDEDAGTCKECYEKVNETEEEQIDDLQSAHNQHIFYNAALASSRPQQQPTVEQ